MCCTLPYKVGSLKHIAALFTNTSSTPVYSFSTHSEAALMDCGSVKSSGTGRQIASHGSSPSLFVHRSSAAAFPNSTLRHAIIAVHSGSVPMRRAISLPIPLLPPYGEIVT